ncbi:MAG: N-acetylmuramoyl-L-alanine amidase [Deltaproteobacteria bacterium HGW-Deltaproteobacteria-14]|nr:MAG: N-acetylmuramoyl-L-alanine amidase [Deltaproteobacteria bacterium HGW-Deltaproteobacteria-14]
MRAIVPWAVDPRDPKAGWVPLVTLLPPVAPVPTRAGELPADGNPRPLAAVVPADAPGPRQGALSGKVVYVSASHGFTWTAELGRWATQRPNTNDIVEDLVSAEAVDQYMIAYLRNAGATVFTVRERDMNPHMVIVDADEGGTTTLDGAGAYSESGTGWQDTAEVGFLGGLAPYQGSVNPFTQGTTRAVAAVTGPATAWATWVPAVPADGWYHVYVSYSQKADRASDAHYVIRHPGGETALRVNQQRHGGTWMDLGRFWFEAGQDEGRGAVILYNDGASGGLVVADAVRLGGGMGDFDRGNGSGLTDGPTSGRPRFEECSRYSIQFSGAPSSVYGYVGNDRSDDVGARSRYAAWQNEPGEDAVYVAWHTNAPDPGRGTSTYVYGPNAPDGSYNFTGVAGSDDLAQAIHDELVGDIRAAFDPTWKDRGIFSAYFGEINPSHNSEMPSALVEVGFHDTAADAVIMAQPRFRQVAARSFYQGIVKYFAQRDGQPVRLSPEAPERVRVTAVGPDQARVAWAPAAADGSALGGDAATSYRVYRSADGRGWDNGTAVSGATELVVDGLAPGIPAFFRVTGVNAGGESFPSVIVAVSTSCAAGPAPSLLVYGFYRLDSSSCPRQDLSAWSLGSPVRALQDEVNRFDYVVDHVGGFVRAGVPFDSAEAPAVEVGDVALAGYAAIDWILGEESTMDSTFSATEQQLVTSWLGLGGRVLVTSGAELLWDLEAKGSEADTAFAHERLGAGYGADTANTWGVVPTGVFAGLPAMSIDDGAGGTFRVFYADVLAPLGGATAILDYDNGAGAAGLWFEGAGWTAVTFGVPLEALHPASARTELLSAVLEEAAVPAIPAGGCGTSGEDTGPPADVDAGSTDTSAPADTVAGDAIAADTAAPADTVTTPDVIVGEVSDGTALLPPYREVRSEQHESGGGCASGSTPAGGLVVALALAFVFVRPRRRRRGPATAPLRG